MRRDVRMESHGRLPSKALRWRPLYALVHSLRILCSTRSTDAIVSAWLAVAFSAILPTASLSISAPATLYYRWPHQGWPGLRYDP